MPTEPANNHFKDSGASTLEIFVREFLDKLVITIIEVYTSGRHCKNTQTNGRYGRRATMGAALVRSGRRAVPDGDL